MIENSIAPPPVASIVIVPSLNPQSVGFVKLTSLIVGKTGATSVTVCPCVTQVPSLFLIYKSWS